MQSRKGLLIGSKPPHWRTSTLGSGHGKLFWIAPLPLCVFALNAVSRIIRKQQKLGLAETLALPNEKVSVNDNVIDSAPVVVCEHGCRAFQNEGHDGQNIRPRQLRNREVPWEGSQRSKLMSRRTERPYKVDGAGRLAQHSEAPCSAPEINGPVVQRALPATPVRPGLGPWARRVARPHERGHSRSQTTRARRDPAARWRGWL